MEKAPNGSLSLLLLEEDEEDPLPSFSAQGMWSVNCEAAALQRAPTHESHKRTGCSGAHS